MGKILTVVIPTYNMEELLDRCLTSLIIDDIDLMKHLEVLVVIDGAKDRSSAIAHKYQDKYPQTFRVIDKENGNYGSCINRGLKEACGKYIKVLDADDWYDTAEFSKLLQNINETDADIIMTDYIIVSENEQRQQPLGPESDKFYDLTSPKCDVNDLLSWKMHNMAVKVQLLRNLDYKQTEGISYTDTEWAFFPFFKAESIQYYHLFVYKYFLGREGQTMDPKVMAKSIPAFLKVAVRLLSTYIAFNKTKLSKCQDIFLYTKTKKLVYLIYNMILIDIPFSTSNNNQLIEIDKMVRQIRPMYEFGNTISVGRLFDFHYINYWRCNNYKDVRGSMKYRCNHIVSKIATICKTV